MLSEREAISSISGLSAHRLKTWVERGWVTTIVTENGPIFGEIDVARMQLICTLRDDLEVDTEVLPAMLNLLDQLYGLRRELRATRQAIAAEPEDIRQRIGKRIPQA